MQIFCNFCDIYLKLKDLYKNKLDKLISGQNIKTINYKSILGEGNLDIEGGTSSSQLLGYVNQNTEHLPTTRIDGTPAEKEDYVKPESNATFPFTIDGITFNTRLDRAIYLGDGRWMVDAGVILQTNETPVSNETLESLTGDATFQSNVNEQFAEIIGKNKTLTVDDEETLIDAVNYIWDEVSKLGGKVLKFKGFISNTTPTGTITNGSLWYQGTELPTTFPINVKTYNAETSQWSSTTNTYNPTTFDLWANLNNNNGYYWFGNEWNLIDENVLVDNKTIHKNLEKELELKDGNNIDGVTFLKLNYNLYTEEVVNNDESLPLNSAVYKELLDNTNSKFEYNDSDTEKDLLTVTLKNNNRDIIFEKEIDFNDKLVFEKKEQTLINKTIDADDNEILDLTGENVKDDFMVHDIKASDYYYGFTRNADNVFTNTTQDGSVNVYSISNDKVITLLGEGTLAGTTLTYDSVAYTRNDALDDYYIDQSDIKFSSVDMAIFLKKLIDGQKVFFKKVSTFVGELGDLNTLYYLTTSYNNYKKGFYLYNGTIFYQIDYKSMKYVSTFNGIEGDDEALYYLDTEYDNYKKGFYRFIEAQGSEPAKFIRINPSVINYVSTFNGVVGNTEDLYYLDTAYDNYEVGFYRFVKATGTEPEKFVLIGSDTKVFTDVDELPDTDISNNTIYRILYSYYEYQGQKIEKKNVTLYGPSSRCLNMAADNDGLHIEDINHVNYTYTWTQLTDTVMQGLLADELVEEKTDLFFADFFRISANSYGPKDELHEADSSYKLYHNPSQTAGSYIEIGGDSVQYVSTFEGVIGDTNKLYYLDTAYNDFKKGFYRYNGTTFVNINPKHFFIVSTFTGVEGDNEALYYLDTKYDTYKVGFYRFVPASGGNPDRFVPIGRTLVKYVSTFNGEEGDTDVLYYLDTAYDDYKVGFYRYVEAQGTTPAKFLLIGSASEVFTDVEELPETNISKDTIYRIQDMFYEYQGQVIPKNEITWYGMGPDCLNMAADDMGLNIQASSGNRSYPWNVITESLIQELEGLNLVAVDVPIADAVFFSHNTTYGPKDYLVEVQGDYHLYHNPTETVGEYLPLSIEGKEYVQYISTFNSIPNPDTSVLYYLTTAYDNYVVGFYRYIQGTPTGTFQLIGHNQVVYLSTFVGVTGNTEKLYYLDTDNQGYRKGFYRYSAAESDFISLDTTGIVYLSTFNNVSGELDYLYYLDTQYTTADKTYKKGFYRYTEREEGGVTVGEFNLILEDKDWIQYLSTFANVVGDSEVLYYLTTDYTESTTKYSKGFYRYNEQSTLFEFISTKVFEDVETLPTTNISDKLIYRQFVKRYTEDGQTIPTTPTGYLSTRPAIVIIDETGITDNGTHYAWEDITDDQMDFWIIRRQISQVYAADLMTMSTCFRTAANHYVYKTHVKYEELYVLYHNPEKAANTYLPLVDGFLYKLETTGLRAYTHTDDVQGEMPIVTSIGDNDPTSQEVHALDTNLATELAIRKAIDEVQAIVDVTTLPTTNINAHSFYRINEEYCNVGGTDYAPVTFYKTNSPTVEITTEGIISGGTTTLWENITDAFVTSLGTLIQQTTSDYADFVKLDENLYNTIENVTIVVAGIYHNPTAAANNWILIDDVELEVDGITTEQIHNKIQANALIPVVDLPTEDIKQKSLYKIAVTHYKDLVRDENYSTITLYKTVDETVTVDDEGLQVEGSAKVLWDNLTDEQVTTLLNSSEIEIVTSFEDAEFVRFDTNIFQYKGSVEEIKSGIYYNTDGTAQGWKLVGESGSEINLDEVTTTKVQGKVQANAILDVPTLPTTNIKINSIYRVNGTFYYHDGALLTEAPQGYNITAQGIEDNWSVTPDGLYWSEDGSPSQLYPWDYPSFIDTLEFEIGRGHFEEVQNFEDATFFKTGTTFDYYTKFAKEQKLTCFHKPTLTSDWVELGSNVVPDEITVVFKNSKLKSNAILEVTDLPTTNIQDRVLYWIPRDKYVVDGQPYYIAHGYKSIDPDVVVTTEGLEVDGTLTTWTSTNIISTIEDLQSSQRILPGVPYLYCDFMWLEGNDWVARDKASIEYSEKGMYFNLDGTVGNWIQLDDSYSKEELDHRFQTIEEDIREDSERLDDVERVTSIALNELHDSITQGGIIDITTLPTENIKTNAIYRKKETVNYTANIFKHLGTEVNPKYLEKFGAKSGHTIVASSTGLKIDSNAVVAWASVSPSMTGWAAAVESLGRVSVSDNPDLTSTDIFYGYNNTNYDYAGSFAIETGVSKSITLTKFFSYDGTTWTNMSTISLDNFQYDGLSDSQKMDNTVYIVDGLM